MLKKSLHCIRLQLLSHIPENPKLEGPHRDITKDPQTTMIPSFLSNLASSNTSTAPISIPNTAGESSVGENGIRRINTMETSLSSSPPISHPLLRNQWATRTRTSSIVSPSTSPLVRNYPSRMSSESTIADDQREVFSIFSSLD